MGDLSGRLGVWEAAFLTLGQQKKRHVRTNWALEYTPAHLFSRQTFKNNTSYLIVLFGMFREKPLINEEQQLVFLQKIRSHMQHSTNLCVFVPLLFHFSLSLLVSSLTRDIQESGVLQQIRGILYIPTQLCTVKSEIKGLFEMFMAASNENWHFSPR